MSISAGGLDGKTALVTGAGRGIGRAIALGLAEAGARVVLLARSEGELDQVAGQVRVHGGRALGIPVDIGDPGQLAAAVKRTRAGVGEGDLLVNNAAAVGAPGARARIRPAPWAAAISARVARGAQLAARSLLVRLAGDAAGQIWNAADPA